MTIARKFGILAVATFAILAATVVLPTATAQGQPKLEVTIRNSAQLGTQSIQPEVGSQALQLTITYRLQNQVFPAGGTVNSQISVKVTFNCPAAGSNILITGPGTVLVSVQTGAGAPSSFSQNADYQIRFNRQAPGLQAIKCTITAHSDDVLTNTAVPAPTDGGVDFTVTAGYYSLVQAKIQTKIQEAGPQQQIPFDIELSNFGNARTIVTFQLGEPKPDAEWKPILPDQLILDTPNGGGGKTTDTTSFQISTPYRNGWINQEQPFSLVLTPVAADDNTKVGLPVTVNVLARVRGIYVPGPEPFLLLAALVGGAMLVRLKKE